MPVIFNEPKPPSTRPTTSGASTGLAVRVCPATSPCRCRCVSAGAACPRPPAMSSSGAQVCSTSRSRIGDVPRHEVVATSRPAAELVRLRRSSSATPSSTSSVAAVDRPRPPGQAVDRLHLLAADPALPRAAAGPATSGSGILHGGVPKRPARRVMADFRAGSVRRPPRHQGGERRSGLRVLLRGRQLRPAVEPHGGRAAHRSDRPHRPDREEDRHPQLQHPRDHRDGHHRARHGSHQVFEHAIGELEPILDSEWKSVEKLLFDFSLTPRAAPTSEPNR